MLGEFPNKLGPYEIEGVLGQGGMGVVYQATDPRLGRPVAIKTLPPELGHDPHRRSRFEREARALASLTHPNVAAIYGVEEHEGETLLVMELVPGNTLSARLEMGALPIDEALRICHDIASGVEAAHEAGIIHRDLKPGNVNITPEGKVKVLDFGLAKALGPDTASGDASNSPTLTLETIAATGAGVILGSAGYMSPEQARGKAVDRRADIWAFGCILYECLTGERAFPGDTVTDSIAAIIERDPDLSKLPKRTPKRVSMLLSRCLEKDASHRLRDIGDARIELQEAITNREWTGAHALAESGGQKRGRGGAIGWIAAVALAIALALVIKEWAPWDAGSAQSASAVRFTIPTIETHGIRAWPTGDVTMSWDGSKIAYSAPYEGKNALFVRDLNSFETRQIRTDDETWAPIFSPDGESIYYTEPGRLMRASLRGGPPSRMCELGGIRAFSKCVTDDGALFFMANYGQTLYCLPGPGEDLVELAKASSEQGILGLQEPEALPDNKTLIANCWTGYNIDDHELVTISRESGSVTRLGVAGLMPRVFDDRHIIFHRNTSLFLLPFDFKTNTPAGPERLVLEGVACDAWSEDPMYAASRKGDLIYVPGDRTSAGRSMVRVDQAGNISPLPLDTGAYYDEVSVSDDGRRIAVNMLDRTLQTWTFDLQSRSRSLANAEGEANAIRISPDGSALAMIISSIEHGYGKPKLTIRREGDAEARFLEVDAGAYVPADWLNDGSAIVAAFSKTPDAPSDIVLVSLDEPPVITPILSGEASEFPAELSPDEKWLLFWTDESGPYSLYVCAYPYDGRRWRIAGAVGDALWSPDGSEIYYTDGDRMMATEFTTDPSVVIGETRELFRSPWVGATEPWPEFDLMPDGSFAMIAPAEWERTAPYLHIIMNWSSELEQSE